MAYALRANRNHYIGIGYLFVTTSIITTETE